MIKKFEDFSENKINEGDDIFGVFNVRIDGDARMKSQIVDEIRKAISRFQGERHLFVDGKEVNPHADAGWQGMKW